ncbi:MAG: DUF4349 domain-containing protein [Niabella sp.]
MKRLFFAIAILPWIFIACNTGDNKEAAINEIVLGDVASEKQEAATATDSYKAFTQPDSGVGAGLGTADAGVTKVPVTIDWDKKIIKTANITLEVKQHEWYASFIRDLVKKYGGYISREDNNITDYKNETNIVIKVPVLQFEELVNGLAAKDTRQLQRSITSEDVTGNIIDTKARLETKKATKAKYLEFLKQAGKMEDVLKVQQEINDIQEDIESASARLAQLSGEAKYSTIHLTYFEPLAGYKADSDKPGFGSRIVSAFSEGGKIFGDIFIGVLTVWPLWLGLVAVIFIFRRFRRSTAIVRKNL